MKAVKGCMPVLSSMLTKNVLLPILLLLPLLITTTTAAAAAAAATAFATSSDLTANIDY
jgi:hypothetical protein